MTEHRNARDLLDFIDASPSPWHAVETLKKRLRPAGFHELDEADAWRLKAGGRYYVVRDDSSIVIFCVGQKPLIETGFRMIGAHTDSPGLRVKPNAAHASGAMVRIGVEIYGGPILATFTDRDLGLAGRVSFRGEKGKIATKAVDFGKPLLRLPNLAIHMNRTVNEDGLKLDKQTQLPLLLSAVVENMPAGRQFSAMLAERAELPEESLLSWELNVYDTQKGAFWGNDLEYLADGQLDNLASCHAALLALSDPDSLASDGAKVCSFFDHEEIGSTTAKGADGSFLPDVLERIACSLAYGAEDYRRILSKSFLISADMAHAYLPNFPSAYDPEHQVAVNKGPVIKVNANSRYASDSVSQAMFADWCQTAGVPYQNYTHRSDIPCGSTIGPITSAKLGVRTVDVGSPMWAMHSARESAGVLDHDYMIKVMKRFFCDG
ncbi:MAG: M18 family aminopeptidase [Gammaproteobacteria bacterium]